MDKQRAIEKIDIFLSFLDLLLYLSGLIILLIGYNDSKLQFNIWSITYLIIKTLSIIYLTLIYICTKCIFKKNYDNKNFFSVNKSTIKILMVPFFVTGSIIVAIYWDFSIVCYYVLVQTIIMGPIIIVSLIASNFYKNSDCIRAF